MEKKKRIIVDNPTGLPLASIDDYILFQGDLKRPITSDALASLKTSIMGNRHRANSNPHHKRSVGFNIWLPQRAISSLRNMWNVRRTPGSPGRI